MCGRKRSMNLLYLSVLCTWLSCVCCVRLVCVRLVLKQRTWPWLRRPVMHTVRLVRCSSRLLLRLLLGLRKVMLTSVDSRLVILLMMNGVLSMLCRWLSGVRVDAWLGRLAIRVMNLLLLMCVSALMLLSSRSTCRVMVLRKWLLMLRLRSLPTVPKLLRLMQVSVISWLAWCVCLVVLCSWVVSRAWPGSLASVLKRVTCLRRVRHLSLVAMLASMLMRRMTWLVVLCIVSTLSRVMTGALLVCCSGNLLA